MSKIEDFENAPVGATATRKVTGIRAMKRDPVTPRWVTPKGNYLSDEEMVRWGCILDAPAPTTVREALDLAWELAHEVKEGQTIPKGTRYLEVHNSRLREGTAVFDIKISSELVPGVRTVEPLLDPVPDWLYAPAVLAHCGHCSHGDYGPQITLHGPAFNRQKWECAECQTTTDWGALSQLTPLYPKEGEEK